MAQHAAIEVIAALKFLDHHVLGVLRVLLAENSLMKGGVEFLTHHLHPGDPLLLQHFNELLVQTLIAAMKGLGLFTLRIELLTSTLEVVDNRKDLTQRRANQLLTQIILISALTLAEIIEISRDSHVLTLQGVVFCTQSL